MTFTRAGSQGPVSEPALVAAPFAVALFGAALFAAEPGNLTTDAHLAALAIEHDATLVSFDRDFERFAGLRFELLAA